MAKPLPQSRHLTMRLDEAMYARVQRHAETLARALPGKRLVLADAVRNAMAYGLDIIEQQLTGSPASEIEERSKPIPLREHRRHDGDVKLRGVSSAKIPIWQVVLKEEEFTELQDSDGFVAAWGVHWKTRTRKLKPASVRSSFRHAIKYGVDVYTEALEMSERNGWQGVFPDKVGVVRRAMQSNSASWSATEELLKGDADANAGNDTAIPE
jgi:hypothetical protein